MATYNETHGKKYKDMLNRMSKSRLIQMYQNAVMEREELRKQIAEMTIDAGNKVHLDYLIKKDEK